MANLIVSAAAWRLLHQTGLVILAFLLAIALAGLSVFVERSGPEQLPYGNLCGPDHSQLCYEPALKGGLPLAYLIDRPGVSVEHQLSFGEDTFRPVPLVLDIAFYSAVTLAFGRFMLLRASGLQRPGQRQRHPDRHDPGSAEHP